MSLLSRLPEHRSQVRLVKEFIQQAESKCLILTGAGVSTDSGIPDYRGPRGVYVKNKNFKPIQYQEFVSNEGTRRRYWARSFLGWPRISQAKPNTTHYALQALERNGWVKSGVITQNVDGLHRNQVLLELHGTLHRVHCLSCGHTVERPEFQEILAEMNPGITARMRDLAHTDSGDVASSVNPDGDAEVMLNYDDFQVPHCRMCTTGVYKPNVTFFGENIHSTIRNRSFDMVDHTHSILAIGTTMQVFSAYRLVHRAKERKKSVAAISLGPTRADGLLDLKIDAPCSEILFEASELLS
ncbi:DHS-like NAD/FAD-binding domain-containing protein [Gaertneriomyces semiglobifer]|nr:DHS-like NAD/FAD-binding domain-containing protein [Gaertneriomyces semiglobifer]